MSENAGSVRKDRSAGDDRSAGGRNKLAMVLGVLLAILLAAIALFFILGGDLDLDAEVDAPNVDVEAPEVDGGGVDVEEDDADVDPNE